jgi:hypothetical protein
LKRSDYWKTWRHSLKAFRLDGIPSGPRISRQEFWHFVDRLLTRTRK